MIDRTSSFAIGVAPAKILDCERDMYISATTATRNQFVVAVGKVKLGGRLMVIGTPTNQPDPAGHVQRHRAFTHCVRNKMDNMPDLTKHFKCMRDVQFFLNHLEFYTTFTKKIIGLYMVRVNNFFSKNCNDDKRNSKDNENDNSKDDKNNNSKDDQNNNSKDKETVINAMAHKINCFERAKEYELKANKKDFEFKLNIVLSKPNDEIANIYSNSDVLKLISSWLKIEIELQLSPMKLSESDEKHMYENLKAALETPLQVTINRRKDPEMNARNFNTGATATAFDKLKAASIQDRYEHEKLSEDNACGINYLMDNIHGLERDFWISPELQRVNLSQGLDNETLKFHCIQLLNAANANNVRKSMMEDVSYRAGTTAYVRFVSLNDPFLKSTYHTNFKRHSPAGIPKIVAGAYAQSMNLPPHIIFGFASTLKHPKLLNNNYNNDNRNLNLNINTSNDVTNLNSNMNMNNTNDNRNDNRNDNSNDNGNDINMNMNNTNANLNMEIDPEVVNKESNLELQTSLSQLSTNNKNSDIDVNIDISMGHVQVVHQKQDLKLQSSSSQLSKNNKNVVPSKTELAMSNVKHEVKVKRRPQRSVQFAWKLNTMSGGKYEHDEEVPITETIDGSSSTFEVVHKNLDEKQRASMKKKKLTYKVSENKSISIAPATGR